MVLVIWGVLVNWGVLLIWSVMVIWVSCCNIPESRWTVLTQKNALVILKGKVDSLPSHQLLWFLASIYLDPDSNP